MVEPSMQSVITNRVVHGFLSAQYQWEGLRTQVLSCVVSWISIRCVTMGVCLVSVDLVFIILLLLNPCWGSSNSLKLGESLTGNQNRTSHDGTFKLGFFKYSTNNIDRWYLGISYTSVPEFTVIWVANRDKPLPDSASAVFNITEEGFLQLSYKETVVWNSNNSIVKKASQAVMQEDGNLVLRGEKNRTQILWESFAEPGNTWMAGMKLRMNIRLTSWRSPTNPGTGLYSLELDPSTNTSNTIMLWNNSVKYWDSGPSEKDTNVIKMGEQLSLIVQLTHNDGGKYYTYSANPATAIVRSVLQTTGTSRISYLGSNHQWKTFCFQPLSVCDAFGLCGAYGYCNNLNSQSCSCLQGFEPRQPDHWNSQDWSQGCKRKTPLNCPKGSDGFLKLQVQETFMLTAGSRVLQEQEGGLSEDLCRKHCLKNCSCTAYGFRQNGSCYVWHSDLFNLQNSSSDFSVFVRINPKDLPKHSSKMTQIPVGTIAGIVGSVLIAICFIVVLIIVWMKRRQKKNKSSGPGSLVIYSYKYLQAVTTNFSDQLGEGGFGLVFKGFLSHNTPIAVKMLEGYRSNQSEKQFRMEVETIGSIHHMNVVRLLGFCVEPKRNLLLLVYEFMPNGSLASILFNPQHPKYGMFLNWNTRFSTILGIARGILYFHEQCRERIIHCDIKPENILLDSDFSPKIADFGMAKVVSREQSRVVTTMRGTRGYLAPEWLSGDPITPKVDVYSFGMMLLEIVSGHRNHGSHDFSQESGDPLFFFPTWAAEQISRGNAIKVLDQRLLGKADEEEVTRVCVMALWCVQDCEDQRPSMKHVLQVLEGSIQISDELPSMPDSLERLYHSRPNSLVLFSSHISDISSPSKVYSIEVKEAMRRNTSY